MLKVDEMLKKSNEELIEPISAINIDEIFEVYGSIDAFCDAYRECAKELEDGDDLLNVEYFLEIDSCNY